jgi:hypothetical protein
MINLKIFENNFVNKLLFYKLDIDFSFFKLNYYPILSEKLVKGHLERADSELDKLAAPFFPIEFLL